MVDLLLFFFKFIFGLKMIFFSHLVAVANICFFFTLLCIVLLLFYFRIFVISLHSECCWFFYSVCDDDHKMHFCVHFLFDFRLFEWLAEYFVSVSLAIVFCHCRWMDVKLIFHYSSLHQMSLFTFFVCLQCEKKKESRWNSKNCSLCVSGMQNAILSMALQLISIQITKWK